MREPRAASHRHGERVLLRPATPADIPALQNILRTPEVAEWWGATSANDLDEELRKVGFKPVGFLRQYERGADGTFHDGLLMDLLRDEFSTAVRGHPRG